MKKITDYIIDYIKSTDLILIISVLAISTLSAILLVGMEMSGYATTRQIEVQMLASAMGIVGAIIMSKIDYKLMGRFWAFHSAGAYILVLLTFFIGIQVGTVVDDRAWLPLPFGLTLQPSEILKASFIITFSMHLQKVGSNINRPSSLLPVLAHGAVPVVLVLLQGDAGTALIFAMIFACMLFAAGLNFKYIIAAIGAGVAAVPFLWTFMLSEYQKLRILTVFNPELDPMGIGWQQLNGLMALGSGQLWGKGVFGDNHYYVAMMYNDFIFTFIGETMGLVGCVAVLLLITFMCIKILLTGLKAVDLLGKYICVGVFAMFMSQTFLNVGMCLGVLPVIGITLPFISAGGTSVAVSYMGIGLSLSVFLHSKKSIFAKTR